MSLAMPKLGRFGTSRPRRPGRPSRHYFSWGLVLILLVFIGAAVFGGLLAGIGFTRGVALYIGLVACVLLLLLPLNMLMGLMFAGTLVAVGLVGYFTKNNMVYWAPYFLGVILYVRLGLEKVGSNFRVPPGPTPGMVWLLLLFIVVLAASTLINEQTPIEILLAAKNYLFMFSVLFICMYALRSERPLEMIWRGMAWVGILQLPVALYQYVVVGGRRVELGGQGWDAVSGTLGGSEFGGQSAGLGLVMITVALLAMALQRAGVWSTRRAAAMVSVSIVVIALAEVKAVVFVLLPAGLALLYWRDLRSRPSRFIAGGMATMGLVVALLASYQVLHYGRSEETKVNITLVDRMVQGWVSETDPDAFSQSTHEMGRVAIVVHWWRENVVPGHLMHVAFGHGPSSLKFSPFNVGSVVATYPHLKINRHTGGVLLWEVGVVGLAVYGALLFSGMVLSARLETNERIPKIHRVYLGVGMAVLGLLLISLFYGRLHFDLAALQLISLLCLGQAGYWAVRMRRQVERPVRPAAAFVLSAAPTRR
ncbi:MAG: hypothetical protein ACKVQR_19680 [Aquabacterium sp.]